MDWFKFYASEYMTDPKILALTTEESHCWTILLCFAAIHRGVIPNLTEEVLMRVAKLTPGTDAWNASIGVLKKFERNGMVTICNDDATECNGDVTLTNWKKRQAIPMSSAERSRKFRSHDATECNEPELHQGVKCNETCLTLSSNSNSNNKEIVLERFDRFWSAYPRKVSKKKAMEAWMKLAPSEELTRKIIAAVKARAQMKDWQKEDGAFIPHPATYLNQERWTDQVGISKPEIKNKYTERDL